MINWPKMFVSKSDRGSNESGFALLSVLVIIAILTPLVVNFSYSARVQMSGADYFSSKIKSREIARAGLESAMLALKKDNDDYDSPDEEWGQFEELSQFSAGFFEEGGFIGTIVDEEGKININNLTATETKGQFKRFLTLNNIDSDSLDYIVDWIDDDATDLGAEDDYYESLDEPYYAKDGKIALLHEIRLIRGVKENIINAKGGSPLEENISIYGNGKININTAPIDVLLSLSNNMDDSTAEEIIEYRKDFPFTDKAKIKDDLKNITSLDQPTIDDIWQMLKVQSDYFSINVRGTVKEISTDLHVVVKRKDGIVKIIFYGEV